MRFLIAVLAFAGIFATPAWALELHDARAQGLVGERSDGYVEGLSNAGGVSLLVSDVNAKRKAEYARIAKEKNQPVDVVAKLAAAQIISGLEPGASYKDDSGAWKKR
jgi:uncharacterized protein YdbL (DUF1318 family)